MDKYLCFFFGHKYFVVQKLSPVARRMCCKRCSESFAMNDEVKSLLPWDSEFHKLYADFGVKIKYLPFEFSKREFNLFK